VTISKTKTKPRPKAKPPRVRLDVDERRAQLLELGIAAFGARAYDDVSLDELAQSAGVSKGLVFHYFGSKRDFYVAGLRESARRLLASTLAESVAEPLVSLRRGLDQYLRYVKAHGAAYRALFQGGIGSDPEVAAVVEETRQAFLGQILNRLGDKLARHPPPLVRTSLRGWVGAVEAASLDWVAHDDLPAAEVRELLVELLVATMTRLAGVI